MSPATRAPGAPVRSRQERTRREGGLAERYGSWAVVAGASEGLGAAFARALARRGLNIVVIARRADLLSQLARQLEDTWNIETRVLAFDLSQPDFRNALVQATKDIEVGVGVYNAAHAPVGPFVSAKAEDLIRVVDVNVRGPVVFAHALARGMRDRRRGAMVLMSSLAGFQGSPRIAAYAASKAFNTILAEGLWGEFREFGVDVVASCPGAIRTPGYAQTSDREAPGTLDAEEVAERTLDALRRGPRVVPGLVNLIASYLTSRILPRRTAVRLMAANTKDLS